MNIKRIPVMEIPNFFDLFKLWRYKATSDKYKRFISTLNDDYHFYFYYFNNSIVGVLVIYNNEIIGIAVLESYHNNGIGSDLIKYANESGLYTQLTAETDDDAVGFYKSCGFSIEIDQKNIHENIRYICTYNF